MISLLVTKLPDELLERVRRNIVDAIGEIQRKRSVSEVVLTDIELEDGIETLVAHPLGRRVAVFVSPVRGASTSGHIEELRDGVDAKKFVKLKATGYGATVTVDVRVL